MAEADVLFETDGASCGEESGKDWIENRKGNKKSSE